MESWRHPVHCGHRTDAVWRFRPAKNAQRPDQSESVFYTLRCRGRHDIRPDIRHDVRHDVRQRSLASLSHCLFSLVIAFAKLQIHAASLCDAARNTKKKPRSQIHSGHECRIKQHALRQTNKPELSSEEVKQLKNAECTSDVRKKSAIEFQAIIWPSFLYQAARGSGTVGLQLEKAASIVVVVFSIWHSFLID